MKSKLFSLIALTLVAVLLLCSCKGNSPSDPGSEGPAPEEFEAVPVQYKSALTGLPVENESDQHRRPVAVMINNIKKALPQYGISKASIIFEALAEGGITRLLAVFEDVSDIPQIGTIRSSRPIYIDLAESIDAVYIHFGASPEAYSRLENDNIDSYDFIEGKNNSLYWRDSARIKSSGYEHSAFTSGERIANKLEADDIRMTRSSNYGSMFNFSETIPSLGIKDATKISAVFSSYKTGTYTYDEELGLYRIGQYGTTHIDAETGGQLAFKNVFLLRMNSYVIPGDTAGRLRFESTGSGEGYYFVNGEKREITWKRSAKDAPFKFYDRSGAELEVFPGDSYIAIVPLNAVVNIEGIGSQSENIQ